MGKSYSVDKSYGQISVQLDSSRYAQGGQVNGWINLSLIKSFPSDVLDIFIIGREKVKLVVVKTNKKQAR